MGLDNLKRWHWCIIGVLFGAAFAAITLWAGPDTPDGSQYIRPAEFEEQLVGRYDSLNRKRVVRLENFIIHAPQEIPITGGRVTTAILSYDAVLRIPPPKVKPGEPAPREEGEKYKEFLIMELPAVHRDRSILGIDVSKMHVQEYLDKLNEKIASDPARFQGLTPIVYKYRWIETPNGAYTIYCGGGFVIVGLIWPTLLSLLTGAGLGRAKAPVDEYDLARFKSAKKKAPAAKPVVSASDMDRLAEVEAELEASLKAGARPRVAQTDAGVAVPEPVRVLNAGPVEAAKVEEKREAVRKGFGADQGDYYPTEVHGKKPE